VSERTDPQRVKTESERVIQSLGGKTLEWLPVLDRSRPREGAAVADRALAMHGLLSLYFQAPVSAIAEWLRVNRLQSALSRREQSLLRVPEAQFNEQDRIDLYWYIEALWALMWAGRIIPALPIDQPVGDEMVSLLPDIERGQSGEQFSSSFALRPFAEVFQMLDLYYRAHWYARDGHLKGYSTGCFSLDIIMERRKALEWIADGAIEDWDDTPDST